MKSVLFSETPFMCENITKGKKTIIVKKSAPSVPFKAYIYATKAKKFYKCGAVSTSDELLWLANGKVEMGDGFKFWANGDEYQCLNRRIIGEFICDKIDKYTFSHYEAEYRVTHVEQNAMCLNQPELIHYGKGEMLYGWHISDLKVYDKPKELSEFKTPPCEKSEKACGNCKWLVKINTPDVYECECYVEDGRPITRPPQSWQYVEDLREEK